MAYDEEAPVVTGLQTALPAYAGTAIRPFAGVTVTDADPNAHELVDMAFVARAGSLVDGPGFAGLTDAYNDTVYDHYEISGTPSQISAELRSLVYTPLEFSGFNTINFTVYDQATNGEFYGTTAIENLTGKGVITIQPSALYFSNGHFGILSQVNNPDDATKIEFFASVDGVETDLGSPASFAFNTTGDHLLNDPVTSGTESNIEAVETDRYGNVTTATAAFTLQNGIQDQPYTALQTTLDPTTGKAVAQTYFQADGSVLYQSTIAVNADHTSSATYSGGEFFDGLPYTSFTDVTEPDGTLLAEVRDRTDGKHRVLVEQPGQTLRSNSFDIFTNAAQPNNTFVFDPGYGLDVVAGLRLGGDDHDTLSFLGSDFGNDVADVLRHARNAQGGTVIHDPTSGDTVRLAGITKAALVHNSGDLTFHA